jgi:4-hydroxybenzoate polyprenyltransferase
MLNRLCLELAPLALVIILGYSWTKRWTALSHFVLGLSLGLAPVGAWLAVTGSFWGADGRLAPTPLLLAAAVVLWVAGFDIIYACQDYEFDLREPRLKSLPKRLGLSAALYLSALLHGGFLTLLVLLPLVAPVALGPAYWAGLGLTAAALLVEHLLVRPDDLSRANAAFFTANGLVSLGLMAAVLVEVLRAK